VCYNFAAAFNSKSMKFGKTIFYKGGRLIIIGFSIFILNNTTNGQSKTNQRSVDVEIYGGQNGNLYTNESNLISIIPKDTTAEFALSSSQGVVWQLDRYMFFVDSLKKGKTKIAIFKVKPGKEMLVREKHYTVLVPKAVTKYNSLSISPDISLGGFTGGKIKLDTLKKFRSLSVNENYTILNATFYVGQTDLSTTSIKSKYFDRHLKDIWEMIRPNCYITVDNIEFMDKKGNRYFYPNRITVMATE